jgi:hypothetical protein
MVPDTDVLPDQPVPSKAFDPAHLLHEAGPFEGRKKQVRSSLLSSGALPTTDRRESVPRHLWQGSGIPIDGTESTLVNKSLWDIREPEVIEIEDFEDGRLVSCSSLSSERMEPMFTQPPLSRVAEEALETRGRASFQSEDPYQYSAISRSSYTYTYESSSGDDIAHFSSETVAVGVERISVVEDVVDRGPHDTWLLAGVERAFSGADRDSRDFEGRICLTPQVTLKESQISSLLGGVAGNSLLERLQRGEDEAVSSGTSGIGTPSSAESEPELDTLSTGPFYQLPSTLRVGSSNASTQTFGRPPANLRRASAPAITVAAQLRSGIVGEGVAVPQLDERVVSAGQEADERIASGAAASASATGNERVSCGPWRPRRPPRPSSATVTRSQSLRVLSDTSSDSGRVSSVRALQCILLKVFSA